MTRFLTQRAVAAGLGMAATFALSLGLAGCGGSPQESGEAVVVPEPGTTAATPAGNTASASGSTAAAPGAVASATPAATSAAPAAPASGGSGGWGTLKGQVVFSTNAPDQPVLEEKGKAEKDPQYCAKDASIKSERLVVDGATKGVKNVLVFVSKPSAVNDEAKSAASKAELVFDQDKCIFEPHVLAMMAGAQLTLKSSDPVNHNVNAKLQKNGPFNQLLAANQTLPFKANTSERSPAPVTCDIHPWMQAWWMVLDHPYFAVTDAKGNFEIKNVPAGTQKVVVWQEATGFVTPPAGVDVAVTAGGEPTSKTFTVDAGAVKPAK